MSFCYGGGAADFQRQINGGFFGGLCYQYLSVWHSFSGGDY